LKGTFTEDNRQLRLEVENATKLANRLGMPVTFAGPRLARLYRACDPADQHIQRHLQTIATNGDHQVNSDDTSAFLALTALARVWNNFCRETGHDITLISRVAEKIQSYAKAHTRHSPARQTVWLSALMQNCDERQTKQYFTSDSLRDPDSTTHWIVMNTKKAFDHAKNHQAPAGVTTLPPVCAINWRALKETEGNITNLACGCLNPGSDIQTRQDTLTALIRGYTRQNPNDRSTPFLQQILTQDISAENAQQWALKTHIMHQQISQDTAYDLSTQQTQLTILDVVAWQLRCIAEPRDLAHKNCVLPLPALDLDAALKKIRDTEPNDTASATRGPAARG
jgi:hypothetical protein